MALSGISTRRHSYSLPESAVNDEIAITPILSEGVLHGAITMMAITVTPRGECEFVHEVAMRIPTELIGDFMGVAARDIGSIADWAHSAMFPADSEYRTSGIYEIAVNAFRHITDYSQALALRRRQHPREDFQHACPCDPKGSEYPLIQSRSY